MKGVGVAEEGAPGIGGGAPGEGGARGDGGGPGDGGSRRQARVAGAVGAATAGGGGPNVSALTEVPAQRQLAQAAVLGGGSGVLLAALLLRSPWAWGIVAAGGAALAVVLAVPARWALLRLGRRYDDGFLAATSGILYGLAGSAWGSAAKAVTELCVEAAAGTRGVVGSEPFFADLVNGAPWAIPWGLPCGFGFAVFGWLQGVSVQHRWPTWDLVGIGIVAVVLAFAPPALLYLVGLVTWLVLKAIWVQGFLGLPPGAG